MVTGLGGVCGLALGFALVLAFARSLGFYFDGMGVRFGWPPIDLLALLALAVIALSAALGVAGALYPAWRVRRQEPFALIHGEAS
jgi:ABC-type antimicrobial peptide transport system permease subunit